VRKVSGNVEGSASVQNSNFVSGVICAYLSRNINRSGMSREMRDNQMSKAVGGEELLSGQHSVGNHFTASGLCGILLLGRGGG